MVGKNLIRRWQNEWGLTMELSERSFLTTMISMITYMIFLSLIGDDFYYNTLDFTSVGQFSVTFFATIVIFVLIPMCGTIGSLSMLESYLNVKYIENEKNLRLTEMNLQYDYYVRLEKAEYIESIESRLERFECHYRMGNTFIDSLLRKHHGYGIKKYRNRGT